MSPRSAAQLRLQDCPKPAGDPASAHSQAAEFARFTAERTKLVSVVIASYNLGRYLPYAVESVLAQSYPEVEVQIVDDGSTDETTDVLRHWQHHPRVRVHRQANGGQARAKNAGVRLSRGAFVAFLDADDVWLPDKLAWQIPLFEGRPELGVVYSDYEKMDSLGQPLPRERTELHRGWISGPLLIENFVGFPTAVVRRSYLERYGGFDESLGMGIDYDLWLRLSARCQFDFVPRSTARYRVWAGQMSGNYRERYRSGIRIMRGFLEGNPRAVDPAVVRRAWANTYTGRGNVTLWRGRDRVGAMRDYARALCFRPTHWPAWRAVLRSFITRREPV
jgi:glycosyltransferase involved in cell wall biosynthesis